MLTMFTPARPVTDTSASERPAWGVRRALLAIATFAGAGCSGLTDVAADAGLQTGQIDPTSFRTPAGALQMYRQAVTQFQQAATGALLLGGVLTDELEDVRHAQGGVGDYAIFDSRRLPEGDEDLSGGIAGPSGRVYAALQRVRTYAVQARGALAKYNPSAPASLRGEVYALQGYAEVYLADLFCSGVPLSELEFEGDYVYKPGSNTPQIYQHALALFDSALVLAVDSARIVNLARVGKGRAWLALERANSAAAAAAAVPDGYRYEFPVFWLAPLNNINNAELFVLSDLAIFASVADREGGNGLPYRSGGDPRTAVRVMSTSGGVQSYVPAVIGPLTGTIGSGCISGNGQPCAGSTAPLVVASGVEARLIQAEAALRAGQVSAWAQLLNTLRTIAITPALPPLPADSTTAADSALRVDVTFAERAKWLFVTGHRQGDLRRLVRQYHRAQNAAYPSGTYGFIDGRVTTYGTDVTLPVPAEEGKTNTSFTGCFSRGA